jgi:hypothetical protein
LGKHIASLAVLGVAKLQTVSVSTSSVCALYKAMFPFDFKTLSPLAMTQGFADFDVYFFSFQYQSKAKADIPLKSVLS